MYYLALPASSYGILNVTPCLLCRINTLIALWLSAELLQCFKVRNTYTPVELVSYIIHFSYQIVKEDTPSISISYGE